MADKVAAVKDAMPKLYPVNKPNGLLNGVLSAFGTDDNSISDEIVNIKKQVFLETAEGVFLDRLGNNYGITRPRGLLDTNFRDIIRHVAFQPKSIINIIRQVLEDLFGPSDGTNWEVFNAIVPGEILIVLRDVSLPRDLVDATYLHGTVTNFDLEYIGSAVPLATVNVGATALTTVLQFRGVIDGAIAAGVGSILISTTKGGNLTGAPATGSLILDVGTANEEIVAYSSHDSAHPGTFTLTGVTTNAHSDLSTWGIVDLNLDFAGNPFVSDLDTVITADPDYAISNVRPDAATKASLTVSKQFDADINGENPYTVYDLVEGGPPGSGKFFGDYIRPNSADRGFDADGTNPSGSDSADGTDPDNPIYYIVILAGDNVDTLNTLVLFVKAAGITVRIETLG